MALGEESKKLRAIQQDAKDKTCGTAVGTFGLYAEILVLCVGLFDLARGTHFSQSSRGLRIG